MRLNVLWRFVWGLSVLLLGLGIQVERAQAEIIFALQPAHDARCLEVEGGSSSIGAAIWMWNCTWTANQQWTLVKVEGMTNTFAIKSVNSGLCLDVGGGVSTENGVYLMQSTCNGMAYQQFVTTNLGRGWYRIAAKHSGRCLDVAESGRENATRVWQWDCQNVSNQYWYAIPLN